MFPIINIGPLALQAAGLILLLSFFFGVWLTGKFASGLGTNLDAIENSLLIGLIAGILGARIGFLLQNPNIFIANPLSLLSLTPSMLDASFGVLVGILTAFILAQKKNLPLWPTLDTLTPFLILIFAGIHLANYANGNAYGIPTDLPWGVELWNAVRHPVQLYALSLAGVLLIWLLVHSRYFKSTGFIRSGVLSGFVLASLAAISIFTSTFTANALLAGSYDLIQLVGLAILIGSLVIIYHRTYPSRKKTGVIISMGSNINPQTQLTQAVDQIADQFRIRRSSSRYLTEDVNNDPETRQFLNQVLEIETDLPFNALVAELKAIEHSLGREAGNKKQVALDLDVLTYGGEVFVAQNKRIPAPDLIKYHYIAQPLAEMTPDFRHPANGLSIQDILKKITDDSRVVKVDEMENGLKK